MTSLTTHTIIFSIPILFLCAAMAKDAGKKGMLGGWMDQDVNSADIKELANKAVAKINAESNDLYQLMPVKIVRAQSHVVAGVEYKLEIVVGRSSCMKSQASGPNDLGSCAKDGNLSSQKTYIVRIWSRPWLSENGEGEKITYRQAGQEQEDDDQSGGVDEED